MIAITFPIQNSLIFPNIFSSFFGEFVRLEFMEGMRQLNYPASEIPQLFCDIDVEPRWRHGGHRRARGGWKWGKMGTLW